MGFSVVGLLGCQVLLKSYDQWCLKLHSFTERETFSITYNCKLSKLRPYVSRRRIMFCRSVSLDDFDERSSPNEVKKEIQECYELIHRLGRGVVYLGSSRIGPNHPHYMQALELSREIAVRLDCTSWSGIGPGLMDAVTMGAMQAGKPVGGFKIAKEAGEWTSSKLHPQY